MEFLVLLFVYLSLFPEILSRDTYNLYIYSAQNVCTLSRGSSVFSATLALDIEAIKDQMANATNPAKTSATGPSSIGMPGCNGLVNISSVSEDKGTL